MIEKELNLQISIITFSGLTEKGKVSIHISKLEVLKKRLKRPSKYPLKGLLWFSSYLDNLMIQNESRKELLDLMEDIPEIM